MVPGSTCLVSIRRRHLANGLQPFFFDDDARTRTEVALSRDIPREIAVHTDGLTFNEFHDKVCNGSPADTRIMREVIAQLARERVIEVRTAVGGVKRTRQTTLMLPIGTEPIFARQSRFSP